LIDALTLLTGVETQHDHHKSGPYA